MLSHIKHSLWLILSPNDSGRHLLGKSVDVAFIQQSMIRNVITMSKQFIWKSGQRLHILDGVNNKVLSTETDTWLVYVQNFM